MPTYIALISYTDQGIRTVSDSRKRATAAVEQAEQAGLTVKGLYWTTGAIDGVLIVEAPDESAATSFFLALGQKGNVRTQTMRAFDREEFEQLMR